MEKTPQMLHNERRPFNRLDDHRRIYRNKNVIF